jgi:hypothetical protein
VNATSEVPTSRSVSAIGWPPFHQWKQSVESKGMRRLPSVSMYGLGDWFGTLGTGFPGSLKFEDASGKGSWDAWDSLSKPSHVYASCMTPFFSHV